MKFIQKYIGITTAIISLVWFSACDDGHLELRLPYPDDITFNELTLDRFSYEIPTAPFTVGTDASGIITVNVNNNGTDYSGFSISNKNFRSYPWNLSPQFAPPGITEVQKQQSIDSTAFSVYTRDVNRTENYLVGKTIGDDAYFTLSKPSTIAHVLVANTSYTYLLTAYGSIYSASVDPDTQSYKIDYEDDAGLVQNRNIQNTSPAYKGVFTLPAPGNVDAVRLSGHEILERRKAAVIIGEAARQKVLDAGGTALAASYAYDEAYDEAYYENPSSVGYVKLIIEGSLNGDSTGVVEFYLAVRPGVDPENPLFDFILNDWKKVDLTSLGSVDKVLFKMSSDYVDDQGKMVYPSMFCLDGIRLQ